MRDMRGQTLITVMSDGLGSDSLIQAVGGRRHPLRRSGVPLHHPFFTVTAGPLLDLRTPTPRITRQFDHRVLLHGDRHGVGDSFTRNPPTKIAGVLPQTLNPQVAVDSGADEGRGITRRGPVERQTHLLLRLHHTIGSAQIPQAERKPRLDTGHPLAQPELTKNRFADRLTGSIKSILGQERIPTRQRRIGDTPRFPVSRRTAIRSQIFAHRERRIITSTAMLDETPHHAVG